MRRTLIHLVIAVIVLTALFAWGESYPDTAVFSPEPVAAQTSVNITWNAVYYDERNFGGPQWSVPGDVTGTSFYKQINAGTNPPGGTNPVDYSVRWTATATLPAGNYLFDLRAEDNARLYINGVLVINDSLWNTNSRDGVSSIGTYTYAATGSSVSFTLEGQQFFGGTNQAFSVYLTWSTSGSTGGNYGSAWNAQYYNCTTAPVTLLEYPQGCTIAGSGTTLSSGPTAPIAQTWLTNSPFSGVNSDLWRVDLTRTVNLQAGTLQFQAKADDSLIITVAGANPATLSTEPYFVEGRTFTGTMTIPTAGTYTINITYYDNTDKAYLHLIYTGAGSTDGNGTLPTDPNNPAGGSSGGGSGSGTQTPTGITATANANVGVNVRQGPGTQYTKIGLAPKGTVYDVTGRLADNTWLRINFNSQSGWVTTEWMLVSGDLNAVPVIDPNTISTDTGTGATATPTTAVTTPGSFVLYARAVGNVRVRTGPATSFARITFVPWGTEVGVFGESADKQWIKIQYQHPTLGTVIGWSYKYWYRETANLFNPLPDDLPLVDNSGVTQPSFASN